MSHEEAETLANARDVVSVANAIMSAANGDVMRTALGLLTIAELLVERDEAMKTALAKRMMQVAVVLDKDLLSAKFWN